MNTIALISCVKEKLDQTAPAKDIYIGDGFNLWYKDAEERNVSNIYILSGKYGLLLPNQLIEPYDLNLGEQSEEYQYYWKNKVLSRLKELHDLKIVHVLIYTNSTYYGQLIPEFNSYEIPYEIN